MSTIRELTEHIDALIRRGERVSHVEVLEVLRQMAETIQERPGDGSIRELVEQLHMEREAFREYRQTLEDRFRTQDQRFESILREANARFEAILQELGAVRREMDTRFEAVMDRFQAQDQRFEAILQEIGSLRREMDVRFESQEKRLSFLMWLFGGLLVLANLFIVLAGFLG